MKEKIQNQTVLKRKNFELAAFSGTEAQKLLIWASDKLLILIIYIYIYMYIYIYIWCIQK